MTVSRKNGLVDWLHDNFKLHYPLLGMIYLTKESICIGLVCINKLENVTRMCDVIIKNIGDDKHY